VKLRLPDPCLVVLVGVAGSGKTTWATSRFGSWRVVSSDALRAVVGLHEHDQRASKDAFAVLERIVDARLRRRFTTVIDTIGLDPKRRAEWIALARRRGVPIHALVLGIEDRLARSRNRERDRPVPSAIMSGQLRSFPTAVAALDDEGFDGVHHVNDADEVELVPARFLAAPAAARTQQEDPVQLGFALHIGKWAWPGGGPALHQNLRRVGGAAEEAGFEAITVMDHVVQIPAVGPEWEDIPESTTVLGFLAAVTSKVRLGALVNGVTYRNLAQLGKQVATLDVLSGGRAFCGLGVAWHKREHLLYGWDFPPAARRYELLEDALELLPLLWGPGTPRFEGHTVTVPEAVCYPRPIQERVPIIVGGSGEKRTLRLVARHADACNLFGEPDVIRHKVAVLRAHCEAEGRDPSTVKVTQHSEAAVMSAGGERYSDAVGTVEEHVGRFRLLAGAGVQQVFVALHEDGTTEQIERFAEVIAAFR
jgi:alkanesulfonate monooxygenase SsuD/methylene tetrahydromethanopterin reductase-like flavin-dependent oxidoreductase (luciferase family)/predicted kinase